MQLRTKAAWSRPGNPGTQERGIGKGGLDIHRISRLNQSRIKERERKGNENENKSDSEGDGQGI